MDATSINSAILGILAKAGAMLFSVATIIGDKASLAPKNVYLIMVIGIALLTSYLIRKELDTVGIIIAVIIFYIFFAFGGVVMI